MSPEEFIRGLQDISISDGIPYGRTRLITEEEQKYNSRVLQYKGHFALSNAFKCFFLETVELLNAYSSPSNRAPVQSVYGFFVPRMRHAFHSLCGDGESLPLEDVTISVERMMRFCQLAEMLFKCADKPTTVLPLHLTLFGTLLIETASFLYSLFDDRPDSTNLVRLWKEFDHPFTKDLQAHATRLAPFKEDLKLVRNRLGFHGSLTRSHEQGGLTMFDVESGRAKTFARLTRDMQILFLRMILWYMKKLDSETHPSETMWGSLHPT